MTLGRILVLGTIMLLAMSACLPSGDHPTAPPVATESPQFYVFALVGDRQLGGRGRAIYLESMMAGRPSGTLQLFPSQPLAGSLCGWLPGDTGSYSLSPAGDSQMTYTDPAGNLYLATSGAVTIEHWFPGSSANAQGSQIGVLTGTFEGSLTHWRGGQTLPMSGGFRVAVAEMRPPGDS